MTDDFAHKPGEGIGLRLREAHYPGRAPIDSYGNGGFRFADMSHKGSLLCLPSGIYGWSPTSFDEMNAHAFAKAAEEDGLEFMLIGTGAELRRLPKTVKAWLSEHGIRSDPMSTGAAVRTLNVLLAENRPVGAALLAVE